jgi:polyisoprenoid-binding protein YceI
MDGAIGAMALRLTSGPLDRTWNMKWMLLALAALLAAPSASLAAAPVFSILPDGSSVTFRVKASVPIQGRFDRWKSTLTFTSPEVSTGVLAVNIDAGSVNTGSGVKNRTLTSDQFFDVKNHPAISFRSTKVSQTGPNAFSVAGNLTIRGVSKPATVVLKTTTNGSGGDIDGTMTFNRRDFGMNGGVPLVRIADSVDVIVHLKAKRVSGPPVAVKS